MTEILPSASAPSAEPTKRSSAKAKPSKSLPVEPKSVVWNPSPADLRRFTEEMPNCRRTEFGNVNVATRVVSRSKLSTFIATDTPAEHSDQTITRAEYERMAKLQNDYLRTRDMLVVEGYIGNDPEFRVPARLIIEKANANIAGMQQHLYYPATPEELEHFEPRVTVIYTPNLKAEGYPEDRLIAVDLENNITRVFFSDYFGESKKGGLRMWNKIVYERGGLALHSGCKVIPVGDKNRVGLIVGLSGTGKTTTTFTKQNNSSPVQDDFCALMPGGKVYATENGCFAKTFGLNVNDEPTIFYACASPHAYQGNRMLELMKNSPMDVYLMNTGRIGGDDKDDRSKKVRIQHSSAIVKAIAEGTIEWERDPDFGYLIATSVPGLDDADYLHPKTLYARQGRDDEYRQLVA